MFSQKSLFLGLGVAIALFSTPLFPEQAVAQTLQRNLERKFPEGFCPLDTPFMGSFTSTTGIIKVTFTTTNGSNSPFVSWFNNRLDNITVIEASEFVAPNIEDAGFCYQGNIVPRLKSTYVRTGNPKVPFFEPFTPLSSQCPWDLTHGGVINSGSGWIELGVEADGTAVVSTNVVISGLTPATPYLIVGDWATFGFLDTPGCVSGSVCMEVRVDDLTSGCGPLSTQNSTWGGVKALYK